MEDFERQFFHDAELFRVLNSSVPHLPSPSDLAKKFYGDGDDSTGKNIGERGFPR